MNCHRSASGRMTGPILQRGLAYMSLMVGVVSTAHAQPSNSPPIKPGRRDVQFQQPAPYASSDELRRRFQVRAPMSAYDIRKERFHLIVPDNYSPGTNWGLFVWVSPSGSPKLPPDWEAALARHRLLSIGAYDGGNERNAFDRFRLAVDAAHNIRQRFRTDPKRAYVSGFSGGGRVASMLAVAYGDIFTGTIPICGVNFYSDLPGEENGIFAGSYKPEAAIVAVARQRGRFALITGENDPNRASTRATYEHGFKEQRFNHVNYFEVPGMGHAMPSAEWVEKALDFLDQP